MKKMERLLMAMLLIFAMLGPTSVAHAAGNQYYYDKYNAPLMSEYTKYEAVLTNNYTVASWHLFAQGYNGPSYLSYTVNPLTGTFTLSSPSPLIDDGTYRYATGPGGQLLRGRVNSQGDTVANYANITNTPYYAPGNVEETGIVAADGTYPANGRHTDGYWYTRTASYYVRSDLVTHNLISESGIFPDDGRHTDGFWYVKKTLYDISPPTVILSPATPTNGDVQVDISYNSTAVVREYTIDSGPAISYTGPINVAANCSISFRSQDIEGTWSTSGSATVTNIDKISPTVTADDEDPNWRTAASSIALTYNDTGSGIASSQYQLTGDTNAPGTWDNYTGPVDISADGTWYLHYRATDAAGNVTTGYFGPYRLDTGIPTVTADDEDPSWRAAAATVTLTYGDLGSGIAASQYKLTGDTNIPGDWNENGGAISISSDGTWYLHYRATDAAGNVTTGYFGPYNIDTIAPADPTLTRSPDQDASKDPYTVSLTHGADPLSGVAGSYYRLTGATTQDWALWPGDITISADGVTTVEAYTRDNVGHDSGTVSISVNVYGQALAAATAAVETSETTKTSADLNTARLLVAVLPAESPEKAALTARLDLVEQYIMISQGLSDLGAALDTAEADTTTENVEACQILITSLQALITALPDGAVKTDYQAQLDLQILRYNAVYDRLQKILELTMNLNAADLDVASDPARLQLADLISAGTAYSSTVTDLADSSQLISAESTGSINVPGTAQGHTYRVNIDGLIDGATVAQRTFDKQQPDTVPPTFTYGYTLGGVLYMGANDNHQLHAAPYAFRTIGDGEDISALQNFVPGGSGFAVTAWTMGDEGELALNWQAPATNPLGATPATVIVYVRDYSLNRADLGFTVTSANQILFGDAYIPQSVKTQIAAANKPNGVTTSDYTVPNALSPTTETEIRGSLQDGSLTIETGAGELNSGEASLVIDLKKDLDALNSVIRTELGTTGNTFYRISISEKATGRLVYSNFVFDAAKIVIPDLQDSTLYTIRIAVVHDAKVLAFRDIEKMTEDRTAPVIERILVQGNTLTVIARDNLQLNALPYQFVQSGSIFASSDWLLDVGQLMAANFGVSSWTNDPTRQVRPGESLRILVRDAQDNYTVMDITAQPEIRIDIINADTPYVAGAGTHTNLRDLLLQILQAAGKTGVSPDNYTLSVSDPSMVAIDGQQLLFKTPGTCYLILTSKIDGSVIKYQIKIGEKIPFDRKVVVQINSEIDLSKAFEKVLVREFGEGAVVGFAVKPGDEEKGLLYDGSIYKAGSAEAIVTVYAGTAARVVPLYLLVVQDEYPASEVEAFRINLPFVVKVGDTVALEDITRAISGLAETQCSKWTIYETESDAVAITGARIEALREGIALVRAVDLANGTVTELTLQIIGFADAGTAYRDTAAHWAQQPVAAAAAKGLLRGYEDGTYRPDNDTTREEFLAVLTRVKALERTVPMAERKALDLKLTHSGWSYYLVNEALNGLTAAEIEQAFGKNANLQAAITREEAAALIASVLDLSTGTAAYTDTTGSNKADAIGAVTQATLMIGYGDGRFGGANSVTRGEMAQIALNLLGNQQLIAKLAN